MTLNKAKLILIAEAQKLRSKAKQKRFEAERLEAQAVEVQKEADKI